MPNKCNRVLNLWCWPLLRLFEFLQTELQWKTDIKNNGEYKFITLSTPASGQVFAIQVEKSVPDEDLHLNKSFRRTRLNYRVEVTVDSQALHDETMDQIQKIIEAIPEPKPHLSGIFMDAEKKVFEFTIGVNENEGCKHRLMIDRPVQEQYALTIYQFFRVILAVWMHPTIPSTISFDEWNKPKRKGPAVDGENAGQVAGENAGQVAGKRKVPESERGMGGAAVDTESDEEEEEQSNHVDRELDRVIPALAGHVNQRATPVVEAGEVSVAPAVDGKIVKKEDPEVKLPLRAPVKKEEASVDLTAEDDPVVKKEEVSVDLTAEDDAVAKTDVVDLT
jgi:hypothetical protein